MALKFEAGVAVRRMLATALMAAGIAAASEQAAACDAFGEDIIGSICVTAAETCPRGTTKADGQLMKINGYQALYSLLGNNFGGDGTSTFALPSLNGGDVAKSMADWENGRVYFPLKSELTHCIVTQGKYPERP